MDFPCGSDGKESACNVEAQDWSLFREDPWRREWLPTPIFLPGKSHEQRDLVGYSPWGRKESDMTNTFTFTLVNAFITQHNGLFLFFVCEDHMQVFNFFSEHWWTWVALLSLINWFTNDSTLLLSHLVMFDSFATPWPLACQTPLSMGFLRQE